MRCSFQSMSVAAVFTALWVRALVGEGMPPTNSPERPEVQRPSREVFIAIAERYKGYFWVLEGDEVLRLALASLEGSKADFEQLLEKGLLSATSAMSEDGGFHRLALGDARYWNPIGFLLAELALTLGDDGFLNLASDLGPSNQALLYALMSTKWEGKEEFNQALPKTQASTYNNYRKHYMGELKKNSPKVLLGLFPPQFITEVTSLKEPLAYEVVLVFQSMPYAVFVDLVNRASQLDARCFKELLRLYEPHMILRYASSMTLYGAALQDLVSGMNDDDLSAMLEHSMPNIMALEDVTTLHLLLLGGLLWAKNDLGKDPNQSTYALRFPKTFSFTKKHYEIIQGTPGTQADPSKSPSKLGSASKDSSPKKEAPTGVEALQQQLRFQLWSEANERVLAWVKRAASGDLDALKGLLSMAVKTATNMVVAGSGEAEWSPTYAIGEPKTWNTIGELLEQIIRLGGEDNLLQLSRTLQADERALLHSFLFSRVLLMGEPNKLNVAPKKQALADLYVTTKTAHNKHYNGLLKSKQNHRLGAFPPEFIAEATPLQSALPFEVADALQEVPYKDFVGALNGLVDSNQKQPLKRLLGFINKKAPNIKAFLEGDWKGKADIGSFFQMVAGLLSDDRLLLELKPLTSDELFLVHYALLIGKTWGVSPRQVRRHYEATHPKSFSFAKTVYGRHLKKTSPKSPK